MSAFRYGLSRYLHNLPTVRYCMATSMHEAARKLLPDVPFKPGQYLPDYDSAHDVGIALLPPGEWAGVDPFYGGISDRNVLDSDREAFFAS